MPRIKKRHPTSLLERAIALAVEVHEGHRDFAGRPYLLHALRVMARVEPDLERVVAVLHDTVENGGDRVSFERLRADGYPEEVIAAVDCLTDREGEPYEDFIARIAPNPLAPRVQVADLADHLDLFHHTDISDRLPNLERALGYWHQLRDIDGRGSNHP
ncbi:MAG TPA: GTP pyrophosphokinase [Chloroflexota bacterium]|nr:GTP pyrophosphokinase [Chloroflexota bacterium]